jgi:hypothetical protein
MEKAHGKKLGSWAPGGAGASRPVLPEPSGKNLSCHQEGKARNLVAAPAAAPSLDLLKHNRNKNICRSCGKFTIYGEAKPGLTSFARLGCKAWKCPRCGPKRARKVRRGIIEQAINHNLNRLLTLTLDPRHCSARDSVRYLKKAFDKFRTYVKRETGSTLSFITVTEFQKNGYAHLHVLVDRYLHQRWAASAWERVGGGCIVDIRKVDLNRVAGYLSKYLTKGLLIGNPNQKYRRYTTSRSICLIAKGPKGNWTLIKRPIDSLMRALSAFLSDLILAPDGLLEGFTVATGA